jgi:hypothetical protein
MTEDTAAPVASETERQEALQYWGQLFGPDKQCSDLLNRLLTAIAKYIVSHSGHQAKQQTKHDG